MPHELDGLREALADRYAVEHELGRGGMATVYLATDRKHHRPVAIKVLKPELAAALGPDRFLREIEVTAGLHHPHILPLYDSGVIEGWSDRGIRSAGQVRSLDPSSPRSLGLLYYVMPFVEGESLRDRLERERQLPLEEALHLTREVAEALGYAHSRGVIHRDIKPENILLENGHALVADFGIAKAITAAGGSRLTDTGLSIGTPAYMSPEQASGTDHLDSRSDLYSLGCVLYEMLAGHPPFTGTTAHELLARHATDPVPPLRTGRFTIPEPIEAAVERALAKVPADRFATAEQFAQALEIDATAYRRRRRLLGRLRKPALVAAAMVIVGAAGYGISRYRSATEWKSRPVSLNTVAVFPFRVTSTDPAIQVLDEGMVDLFYAHLTGDIGPRAVEPTSLLLAWNGLPADRKASDPAAALEVASRFGAGQVLEGAVVQAGTRITINGWLRHVPDGAAVTRHTVQGPADSVAVLARELALGLLGGQLGEDAERLPTLGRHDQRAVAAYFAGVRAQRNGNPLEAYGHFERAEALDSGFALPVMRMALLYTVVNPGEDEAWHHSRNRAAILRASALQDALSPRDRLALIYARTEFRADTATTAAEALVAAQRWAAAAPDDADAQLTYAKQLWSVAALAQVPEWEATLREIRARAWTLDSVTPGRIIEQAFLSATSGDTMLIDRVWRALQAHGDSASEQWIVKLALAHLMGDSAAVRQIRPRFLRAKAFTSWNAWAVIRSEYVPGHDAVEAIDSSFARGLSEVGRFVLLVPRGRVRESVESKLRIAGTQRSPFHWMVVVEWATAYDGLDSAAATAVDSLEAYTERTVSPDPLYPCIVLLHRAWRGDTAGAAARTRRLWPQFEQGGWLGICPAMVEALLERGSGTQALERLERLARRGPDREFPASTAMLLVARLRRERGDLTRALQAAGDAGVRSTPFYQNLRPPYLREEGELAVLVGDTARAIQAFSRYLNIRVDPDPGVVQAEVDSVRAALNALLRAKG